MLREGRDSCMFKLQVKDVEFVADHPPRLHFDANLVRSGTPASDTDTDPRRLDPIRSGLRRKGLQLVFCRVGALAEARLSQGGDRLGSQLAGPNNVAGLRAHDQ